MKRKAIYLDVNADLASALSKLGQVRADEVILVVPKGSAIFHSVVNIKILNTEANDLGKSLALVTTDARGQELAARAGVTVYSDLDLDKDGDASPATPPASSPPKERPAHSPDKKSEVRIQYKRKVPQSEVGHMVRNLPPVKQRVATKEDMEEEIISPKRNRAWGQGGLVAALIAVAVLVLAGVAYFVLPRAAVHLDVQAEEFNHRFRLVLADEDDLSAAGQNVFKGRFVEVSKEVVQNFPATGSKNLGDKASGTVVIYNYTRSIKGLIPETRFVSPDGQVFRIGEDVLIAAARPSSGGSLIPGRASAAVTADEGGSQGNLPPDTKFTIPGLGATGVDLVFGENEEAFSGGTDDEVGIVTEEDIESARQSVSQNVFLDIETELQEEVERGEELVPELIQNDVIDSVPSVAAGAERETFDLKVQVRSWTLLPDEGKLDGIIANTARTIVPKDQALTPQTIDGAKLNLDNADFLMHTIDFTVELDGLIANKLDLRELSGAIANRSPESVERLLNSVPDVISHTIDLWPFWVKRLPLLESNIRIDVAYISQ